MILIIQSNLINDVCIEYGHNPNLNSTINPNPKFVTINFNPNFLLTSHNSSNSRNSTINPNPKFLTITLTLIFY